MAASTLLQLIEVVVAAAILLFGVLRHSAPISILGGGLLIGIAITALLAPEGGTVYRRALVGYTIAGIFVLGGFVVYHFAA
jgi:hypothetical protein